MADNVGRQLVLAMAAGATAATTAYMLNKRVLNAREAQLALPGPSAIIPIPFAPDLEVDGARLAIGSGLLVGGGVMALAGRDVWVRLAGAGAAIGGTVVGATAFGLTNQEPPVAIGGEPLLLVGSDLEPQMPAPVGELQTLADGIVTMHLEVPVQVQSVAAPSVRLSFIRQQTSIIPFEGARDRRVFLVTEVGDVEVGQTPTGWPRFDDVVLNVNLVRPGTLAAGEVRTVVLDLELSADVVAGIEGAAFIFKIDPTQPRFQGWKVDIDVVDVLTGNRLDKQAQWEDVFRVAPFDEGSTGAAFRSLHEPTVEVTSE